MKKIFLLTITLVFAALYFQSRTKPNLDKYVGLRINSNSLTSQNLSVNKINSLTVTPVLEISIMYIFVSEPVVAVSEGSNVNINGILSKDNIFNLKKTDFKSILHDIEMRKLDLRNS